MYIGLPMNTLIFSIVKQFTIVLNAISFEVSLVGFSIDLNGWTPPVEGKDETITVSVIGSKSAFEPDSTQLSNTSIF
jgi:hypothetical protein